MSTDVEWLPLSEAASQLGVHPSTLRRWANRGVIPSTRTAGGHRRFARTDLQDFQRDREKLRVIGGLERGLADTALARTRQEISARENWPVELDNADRRGFRQSGRELLGLTIQYVAMGDGGESLLRRTERIAGEYAQRGRGLGLSLPDLLQLLMFFRDNIMESTLHLPQADELRPEVNQRLFRRMSEVLNAFHLAVVETFTGGEDDEPNA